MLKTSFQLAGALSATSVDDSKVVRNSDRKNRKSAKSDFTKSIRKVEKPSFLTPNTRQAFTQLRQVFTKAPVLRYFHLEHHIQIKTNASDYAIGSILSQITLETS